MLSTLSPSVKLNKAYQCKRLKTASVITDTAEVSKAASRAEGPEKSQLLAHTTVPLPTALPAPRILCHKERRQFIRNLNFNAKNWMQYAPVYRLRGINIGELAVRPKPSKRDRKDAQEIMVAMADWEADACSAKFCDQQGTPILAYFAHRAKSDACVFPKAQDEVGTLTNCNALYLSTI